MYRKMKMTSPKVPTNKEVDTLLDKLIGVIREADKPIVVCDKLFKCEGWEKHMKDRVYTASDYYNEIFSRTWIHCPWCGHKIWRE
jgi:hypothetical protein